MFKKAKKITDDLACNKALHEIAKGNAQALSVIYQIYGRMILSVAFQILHNEQDAEDVLQDVMLLINKNAEKYHAGTNPRAWVMTVTRNRAMNVLKRKREYQSIDELEHDSSVSTDFDSELIQSTTLEAAFHSLSKEEQMTVKLKLFVGLSHAEIASVMKVSKACSEKRYERAIQKLQNDLKRGE